jgi:hypothetical protein
MLSKKENFLETIKKDGKPDRLVNGWEAIEVVYGDPYMRAGRAAPEPGMGGFDDWGTEWKWLEGQPSAAPYHTPENLVIKDVTKWKEQLTIPHIDDDHEAFASVREEISNINREEKLVCAFMAPGLFERLHRLMGFEDALMGMLKSPGPYMELCEAIAADRMHRVRRLVEEMKPDMILSHDDWGTQRSLFMSPKLWRKYLKPHYAEFYGYLKEQGVITIHHADSFLEPIIEDMVEIGIDIWQGALPENDIPKLQEQLGGRMTLMGGIAAQLVDTEGSTEEEIREEVRRACETYAPGGHYIPAMTYGGPHDIIYPHVEAVLTDEIDRFNNKNN